MGGETAYGHRVILMSGSEFFRKLFTSNLDLEPVPEKKEVPPEALKKVEKPKKEIQEAAAEDDTPEEFLCPIGQDLMDDPVLAEVIFFFVCVHVKRMDTRMNEKISRIGSNGIKPAQ